MANMNARAIFFRSLAGHATCFSEVEKQIGGLPNLDLTSRKFVKGCLASTHVTLLKNNRTNSDGLATHDAPTYFIWGIAFYVQSLCIIALNIRLDLDYLELLKLCNYETLETRIRQRKAVSKVIHLNHKDEWTLTNENTLVPQIPSPKLASYVKRRYEDFGIACSKIRAGTNRDHVDTGSVREVLIFYKSISAPPIWFYRYEDFGIACFEIRAGAGANRNHAETDGMVHKVLIFYTNISDPPIWFYRYEDLGIAYFEIRAGTNHGHVDTDSAH